MATFGFNKTKYYRKAILDHTFGVAPFTQPAETYLALFTADPTNEGLLDNELNNVGYAREALNASMTDAVLETGQISNIVDIEFGTPGEDWDPISHAGIMDALTTGNMLYFAPAISVRLVTSGDPFILKAGQLVIFER